MKILGDFGADGCKESASNTKSEPIFNKNHSDALQSTWWDCGSGVRTEVEDTISMILRIKKFRRLIHLVRLVNSWNALYMVQQSTLQDNAVSHRIADLRKTYCIDE